MAQPVIEFYKDQRREWRWRFKAGNGKIIATSTEGYDKKLMAERNVDFLMQNIGTVQRTTLD